MIYNRNVIFVGNGINRLFGGINWDQCIEDAYKEKSRKHCYDKIKELPYSMRIVAATDDSVDKYMKTFSAMLFDDVISEERSQFLQKILSTPAADLITANYSLELEQAAGIPHKRNKYYAARKDTKECTATEKKLRLYTYFDAEAYQKRIWHIHGDITTPNSLIMGHYYYGKLLREIQTNVPSYIRRYKAYASSGLSYEAESWAESFLINDVHMFGFQLDLAEIDLWWLICCKKRNFPDTKIVFYASDMDFDCDRRLMLEAYGVTICDDIPLDKTNYRAYYDAVIDKIQNADT